MSQHYNQSYTKEEIAAILQRIQDCVRGGKYTIAKNENTHIGYEYETLYVFCPQVTLFNLDNEKKLVDIYTKFNIIDMDTGSRVVIISFHERNKPIDYLFR